MIKKAFIDADGKLNSQNVLSTVALLIFGFDYHGNTADIMNFVNTLLAILGVWGLADNSHQIKEVKKQITEK